MKKICYLLCMICTLGVFNACSDDDDDMDQMIPVSEIVVPAKVQAGSELIIAGNGFSSDCKILLKNSSESIALEVSERLSSSIGCTVPATLAPGEYTVILVQGGEWPLRKITVLEEGAGNPDLPVVALVFPQDPVKAGEEVSILGIGFAKECEIGLKVGEEWQRMEITVSNNGVKFRLPETLAAGTYPVILKQDKGQWTLGEITVEAEPVLQKTQIDRITERWTKKGTDHAIVNSYTYAADGRLSSIETVYDGEKDSRLDFKWASGTLTVEVNYWDFDLEEYYVGMSYEYTLGEGGNVVSTEAVPEWTYYSGYLKTWDQYEYAYGPDNRITACVWADEDWPEEYIFNYDAEQANKSVLDLMGEVLFHLRVESEEVYYARLAGICGQAPALLPDSVGSEDYEMGSMTYETEPDGYVSKIIYDDEHAVEITYK